MYILCPLIDVKAKPLREEAIRQEHLTGNQMVHIVKYVMIHHIVCTQAPPN
jgi:hypothetical protein